MVTAAMVKELRERTGAGMMDCKKALEKTDGDIEKAIDLLRKRSCRRSQKMGRITAEGIVDSYIHMGGRIGVLIEVNCETDFVAKTDNFKAFVKNMAMQVAASKPLYVCREEIPTDTIEKERQILHTAGAERGQTGAYSKQNGGRKN